MQRTLSNLRRHPRLAYIAAGLWACLTLTDARAEVFLDAYTKAQPVISRMVEAYGGAEVITSINTVYFKEDNTVYQRYQSRRLGPPFDTVPTMTEIAYDKATGNFFADFGGQFPTRQIVNGDDTLQIDMTRMVATPPPAPIDPSTHFIHRVVPALMAARIYQRAQNVTWAGQSRINGRVHDALSVSWDTGQVYMVHVDTETGLIRRYDILFPDFVAGDTLAESYFEDYKNVDGIPTPQRRWQQMAGQMTFDARLVKIEYNGDVSGMFDLPADMQAVDAPPAPEQKLRELSAGVWIGNGPYQNLYIDTGDFLVSVDAGGGAAVIENELAQLETLTGGKPLKYSVITHHHSDHTNGVDALAATGSTLLADAGIHDYLAGIVHNRHYAGANTIRPAPAEPSLEATGEKRVIEGKDRRIEVYRVPNAHAEDYYVVYLPAEKILYGADVFNLPPSGPLPPADDNFATFWDHFIALGLEVEIVANAHGRLGSWDELETRAATRVAAR